MAGQKAPSTALLPRRRAPPIALRRLQLGRRALGARGPPCRRRLACGAPAAAPPSLWPGHLPVDQSHGFRERGVEDGQVGRERRDDGLRLLPVGRPVGSVALQPHVAAEPAVADQQLAAESRVRAERRRKRQQAQGLVEPDVLDPELGRQRGALVRQQVAQVGRVEQPLDEAGLASLLAEPAVGELVLELRHLHLAHVGQRQSLLLVARQVAAQLHVRAKRAMPQGHLEPRPLVVPDQASPPLRLVVAADGAAEAAVGVGVTSDEGAEAREFDRQATGAAPRAGAGVGAARLLGRKQQPGHGVGDGVAERERVGLLDAADRRPEFCPPARQEAGHVQLAPRDCVEILLKPRRVLVLHVPLELRHKQSGQHLAAGQRPQGARVELGVAPVLQHPHDHGVGGRPTHA
mmetsp:Transcript_25792/g.81530  ORF Transcript_25792/g.81530 Transcript_25792/m.81530 type:complete len:405 (+) Transcript_25792:432-1646(+)